jgi:hypothetical protein
VVGHTSFWDPTLWVDRVVRPVVVRFVVRHEHRLGHSGCLVDVTGVVAEVGVVDDASDVAFEVPVITVVMCVCASERKCDNLELK